MRKHTLLFLLMLFASAFAFGQTAQPAQKIEHRTFIEETKDGDYLTIIHSFKEGYGYDIVVKNKIIVSKSPKTHANKIFHSKEEAIIDAKEEIRLKKE